MIGIVMGRRAAASPPIARLLSGAKTVGVLPPQRPLRVVLARLWPLLLSTLVAGGLALLAPQIPAVATGFAMIWALAWRQQHAAIVAIEHRDGAALPRRPDARRGGRSRSAARRASRRTCRRSAAARRERARPRPARLARLDRRPARVRRRARRRASSAPGRTSTIATAAPPRPVRTLALTDLAWALRGARAPPRDGAGARARPDAVVYSTITAALLAPAPGRDPLRRARARATGPAATASGSARASAAVLRARAAAGPGQRGGARRRARRATDRRSSCRSRSQPSGPRRSRSATSPRSPTPPTPTRRASSGCWRPGRRRGARARSCSSPAARASRRPRACARSARCRAPSTARSLRRARVYVSAPRREEYGIAQLEALADGAMLVAARAPRSRYAALSLARAADPRLVGERPRRARSARRSTIRSPGYARGGRAAARAFSPRERRPARRGAAAAGARRGDA